jgi:hypothetical protein
MVFVLFWFGFLRDGLATYSRLVSNSLCSTVWLQTPDPLCHNLPSARIREMCGFIPGLFAIVVDFYCLSSFLPTSVKIPCRFFFLFLLHFF